MPRIRRAGRPGLMGTAARTAVVVGTAGAVSSRQQQRAQQRAAEQQPPPAEAAAPAAPAPPAPPAPPAADDLTSQLQRLGDLHAAGTLTDDEFAAAKARLLS